MNKIKGFNIRFLLIIIGIIFLSNFAMAISEDYPNRPITCIVPFSAGGSSDIMARVTMPYVEKELGVPIVIENRAGAGGQLGLMEGLRAEPDGYTFMQVNAINLVVSILLQDAPYKVQDFDVFCSQHNDPTCVVVLNDSPYEDFVSLIESIKENPGKIALGATSTSAGLIFLTDLKTKLQLDFKIVTYAGGSEGRVALLGKHIDGYIANVMSNMSIRDQARSIGVGGDESHVLWPEANTFDEQLLSIYNYKAPRLPSLRGFAFPKEFKEKYPERFDKFFNAYEKAYFNEEHLKECEKTDQLPIMQFISPDEAQKAFEDLYQTITPYINLLKG